MTSRPSTPQSSATVRKPKLIPPTSFRRTDVRRSFAREVSGTSMVARSPLAVAFSASVPAAVRPRAQGHVFAARGPVAHLGDGERRPAPPRPSRYADPLRAIGPRLAEHVLDGDLPPVRGVIRLEVEDDMREAG